MVYEASEKAGKNINLENMVYIEIWGKKHYKFWCTSRKTKFTQKGFLFVFHLETSLKIRLSKDLKSHSSKETNSKFSLIYRKTIIQNPQNCLLSYFSSLNMVCPHIHRNFVRAILKITSTSWKHMARVPRSSPHPKLKKDPSNKWRKLYLCLRRVPWRFWIWLRQMGWILTSIRVFEYIYCNQQRTAATGQNITKMLACFTTKLLHVSLKISWKNQPMNVSFPFSIFSMKEGSVHTILCQGTVCPVDVARCSLQSVSADRLLPGSVAFCSLLLPSVKIFHCYSSPSSFVLLKLTLYAGWSQFMRFCSLSIWYLCLFLSFVMLYSVATFATFMVLGVSAVRM